MKRQKEGIKRAEVGQRREGGREGGRDSNK